MSSAALHCPKCQGNMVQGFIMDCTYGARLVSQWAEGPPQKSFWGVTKRPADKPIPIGTIRCNSCGFLESYAREEFASQ